MEQTNIIDIFQKLSPKCFLIYLINMHSINTISEPDRSDSVVFDNLPVRNSESQIFANYQG